MTDEELEALLGEVAREDAGPIDPRWEAYTRGELTPEAMAELEALDPEKAELYRPLDTSVVSAIVEAHVQPAPSPESIPAPANSPWRWALLLVAVAAAVLVVSVNVPAPDDLPTYAFEISGGRKEMRSETPVRVPVLTSRTPLTVRLRPNTASSVEADVRVLADGDVRLTDVDVKHFPSGAVELTIHKAPLGTTSLSVVARGPAGDEQTESFAIEVAE